MDVLTRNSEGVLLKQMKQKKSPLPFSSLGLGLSMHSLVDLPPRLIECGWPHVSVPASNSLRLGSLVRYCIFRFQYPRSCALIRLPLPSQLNVRTLLIIVAFTTFKVGVPG